MLRTNWFSWLKNRSVSQKYTSRRRRPVLLGGIPDWLLEDRCLLSVNPVMVPTNAVIGGTNSTNAIFWNGGPALPGNAWTGSNSLAAPPAKTVTIQNNSTDFIYPFLSDPNTGSAGPGNGPSSNRNNWYDPFDSVPTAPPSPPPGPPPAPSTDQHREYIGYVGTDGKWYLGLPPGATITIQVPLVFWDSGRLNLATDGTNLITNSFAGVSNPFKYDPKASLGVSLSVQSNGNKDPNSWVTNFVGASNVAKAGLVMFYSSTANPVDPASDAPAQLTEISIRDPYMQNWVVLGQNPPNKDLTLSFDYDVSAVDSLAAPTSIEASQVPINNLPNGVKQPTPIPNFGWAGSQLTYATMLNDLKAFTNPTNNTLLGQYFGGQGWPKYYSPNNNDVSIPGGYNIFAQSPLNGTGSNYLSYVNGGTVINNYMLTSNGGAPMQATASGSITASNQTTFTMNFPSDNGKSQAAFFQSLQQLLGPNGTNVVNAYISSSTIPTPMFVGTVNPAIPPNPSTKQVTLKTIGGIPTGAVTWKFTQPVTDYAATDITNLWYAWAQYYYTQGQSFHLPPNLTSGTIAANSNVLQLPKSVNIKQFKVGMTVSGPGIVPAAGTTVTVLYVNTAKNQLYLSQLSTLGGTGSLQNPFIFGKPQAVPFANSSVVKNITVKNGGSGYSPTNPPTINITGGNGSGATAQAIIVGGVVTSVLVTNGGINYTAAPTVTISGGNPITPASGFTAQLQTTVTPLPFFATLPQSSKLLDFAGSVYEALTTEATVPNIMGKTPNLPAPMTLVGQTIGTNASQLPNSLYNGEVSTLSGAFTNTIISILRGVPDFTIDPYNNPSQWYPNPAQKNVAGPTPFNIYNLDPYVWFIHATNPQPQSPGPLGMSVYAFSVDDGVGNVNAVAPGGLNPTVPGGTPNNIEVVFSGAGDNSQGQLPNYNTKAYFPTLNWGTVSGPGNISKGSNVITLTNTPANQIIYNQITPPAHPGIWAYVSDSKGVLPKGEAVTNIGNLQFRLSIPLASNAEVTGDTFTFTGTASSSLGSPPPVRPPSPPPSRRLPGASNNSSSPSTFQEIASLVTDEAVLTLEQVVASIDAALGLAPNPALESSIAAHQNAINANPLDDTLLGELLAQFVELEVLSILQGLL